MPTTVSPFLLPILMLLLSNIFMTFAWYGHLRYKESPMWAAIMVSWGIAFFEYCLQVPANRWGRPDDIGRAVLPLVQGAMAFSTGSVIAVDGGLSIPRL